MFALNRPPPSQAMERQPLLGYTPSPGQTTPSPASRLPRDIREYIASKLRSEDLARLACTSKDWWETLRSLEAWKNEHERYDSPLEAPQAPPYRGRGGLPEQRFREMENRLFDCIDATFVSTAAGIASAVVSTCLVQASLIGGAATCLAIGSGVPLACEIFCGCPATFDTLNRRAQKRYAAQLARHGSNMAAANKGRAAVSALSAGASTVNAAQKIVYAEHLRQSVLVLKQFGQAGLWEQAWTKRDTAALMKLLDAPTFSVRVDRFCPPAAVSELINAALAAGQMQRVSRLLEHGGSWQAPDSRGVTPEQAAKKRIAWGFCADEVGKWKKLDDLLKLGVAAAVPDPRMWCGVAALTAAEGRVLAVMRQQLEGALTRRDRGLLQALQPALPLLSDIAAPMSNALAATLIAWADAEARVHRACQGRQDPASPIGMDTETPVGGYAAFAQLLHRCGARLNRASDSHARAWDALSRCLLEADDRQAIATHRFLQDVATSTV